MIFRHCHTGRVTRPRGLCWGCYHRAGIRDLYPSTSKYGQRGLGQRCGKVPACPTRALPGSAAKIAVLVARVGASESLWHPGDA